LVPVAHRQPAPCQGLDRGMEGVKRHLAVLAPGGGGLASPSPERLSSGTRSRNPARRRMFRRKILCLGLVLLLGACTTNPSTGRQQFTALMPESQEASVGAEGDKEITAQYGVSGDDLASAYVAFVGNQVAAQAERQDIHYRYTLLDTDMVN